MAFALLLTAGCATTHLKFSGGRIHNGTGREVRNLRIVHHPTEQLLTCSALLPGRDLALRFEERELLATSATLAWDDARFGPQIVSLDLTRLTAAGGPNLLIYTLDPTGHVNVRLSAAE